MKKNISRNPLWPDWYNGKKIDEVQFGAVPFWNSGR